MKACLLLICCLLTAVTPAMGDDLSPSDFAYGLPLTVANDHALHALTVPLAVYEKSTRKDLGDVRVFNGAGSVVPHALRQVSRQEEEVRHSIPFFPLAGGLHSHCLRTSQSASPATPMARWCRSTAEYKGTPPNLPVPICSTPQP
jgi:hypothetical protein